MCEYEKCPQCRHYEGGMLVRGVMEPYLAVICNCCGFVEVEYPEDKERVPVKTFGYGVKHVRYDPTLGLGYGESKHFESDTDYEKEVEIYDRLVSIGVVLPDRSYITKADGSVFIVLRGDIKNAENYNYRVDPDMCPDEDSKREYCDDEL